ncbi:type IV pilus modification PilV family protein [Exiguobacterium aurantiacum]|uniref:type IV pilus modification PilV family protein n=1 Tax=Exiguobacterium aurantiacum TaxID=33987 RepID=UPI003CFC27C7
MRRFWKGTLIAIGVLAVGMGGLAFMFNQSMQSDPDEEAKAIELAEPYVAERFDNAELTTEVTFDNMGNLPFEYAATAVDSVSGTEFFVYADETTGEVVDTFLASKWEDDVTDAIEDSVMTAFGHDVTYDVFYDEVAVRQLDASAANRSPIKQPTSYRQSW